MRPSLSAHAPMPEDYMLWNAAGVALDISLPYRLARPNFGPPAFTLRLQGGQFELEHDRTAVPVETGIGALFYCYTTAPVPLPGYFRRSTPAIGPGSHIATT